MIKDTQPDCSWWYASHLTSWHFPVPMLIRFGVQSDDPAYGGA